jgi:hypothetical protein
VPVAYSSASGQLQQMMPAMMGQAMNLPPPGLGLQAAHMQGMPAGSSSMMAVGVPAGAAAAAAAAAAGGPPPGLAPMGGRMQQPPPPMVPSVPGGLVDGARARSALLLVHDVGPDHRVWGKLWVTQYCGVSGDHEHCVVAFECWRSLVSLAYSASFVSRRAFVCVCITRIPCFRGACRCAGSCRADGAGPIGATPARRHANAAAARRHGHPSRRSYTRHA